MATLRGSAVGLIDDTLVVRWANPSFERMFGYDPTGRSALEFLHPDDLPFAISALVEQGDAVRIVIREEMVPQTAQMRVRHDDGRWLVATLAIEDRRAEPDVASIVIRLERQPDRSAMGRALDLIANDGALRQIADTVLDYVRADSTSSTVEELFVRWHADGADHVGGTRRQLPPTHALVNHGLGALSGSQGTSWLVTELPPGPTRDEAEGYGYTVAWVLPVRDDGGHLLGELTLWSTSGLRVELRPELHLSMGCQLLRIALIESSRRRAMRAAALTDSLTGLSNRSGLETCLHQIRSDRMLPVVAMFIDLDKFKQVNDTFGHAAGDQVLEVTGLRIAQWSGTLCAARLGGDEFVVVRQFAGDQELREFVRHAAEDLTQEIQVAGERLRIGASIGTAVARTLLDLATVVREADVDLYRAKHSRRRPDVAEPPLGTAYGNPMLHI